MEKKELVTRFDEVRLRVNEPKHMIGKVLAERVLRTWKEEFTDEDTGEIVPVERTEVVLDKKGHKLTKEDVSTIMFYIQSGDIKDVLVTNQERTGWYETFPATTKFEVVIRQATGKHVLLVHADSVGMAIQIAIDYCEQVLTGTFYVSRAKVMDNYCVINYTSKSEGSTEDLHYFCVNIERWDDHEGWVDSSFMVQCKDADVAIDILRGWIETDEHRKHFYEEYRVKNSKELPITDVVPVEFSVKYVKEKRLTEIIMKGQSVGHRAI